MTQDEDDTRYQVVVNHEEQYSIWPADRQLPLGWQAEGFSGSKAECLQTCAHCRCVGAWTTTTGVPENLLEVSARTAPHCGGPAIRGREKKKANPGRLAFF
jgi:uncharacterized protein YbdZ (MbtH family)